MQTAAVIGTEVPLPLLHAITESPEVALHHGLAHLQAAEFLYETRLFPDVIYTFKHALTHEVAYGSLLQERRRALYARIIEALERLHADRLAELGEFRQASTVSGAPRDGPCGFSASSTLSVSPRSAIRPKLTTARLSLWPKNSACARSWPTATSASACSIAR